MSEQLPKYMLLNQNSEEIRDKRIKPDTVYNEQGDRAIPTKKMKIINTLALPWKVSNSSSIYNIQYSSKYGVLLIATSNEVIAKTTNELEQDLILGKQEEKASMSIKFSGQLFLSPDEEVVAICSESLIQFVKISSLAKSNNIETPPIPNINESNHFLWIDNTHFLTWKFQGTAVIYTIDPNTLALSSETELPMQYCTGASVIHKHLFLISKMVIKIFQLLASEYALKTEIDMTDPNHECPFFEYSFIIDIFKINIKQTNFTPHDVYGFVVVFYDVDEDDIDQRYLTFARGDIFQRESLEIRGYEDLYSTKTSRDLFYNDDQQMVSFSVKRIVSSGFITIMLEKSEKVYVIDPLQDFEKLNVYDIKSKHELKNDEGKFLQGMAIMRNMLNCERIAPEGSDELLQEIVRKYNGEFMSLYFKDKETNLTVAFPASLLAIGGDKFYRKYVISSVEGIEDENNKQIFESLEKIKRSPHILEASQCRKIGEKKEPEKQKQQPKQEPKPQSKKEVKQEQKQETKKEEIKTQQKKQAIKTENKSANIFNANAGSASLFGPKPTTASQLFGSSGPNSLQKPMFSNVPNLFGQASTVPLNPFAPKQDSTSALLSNPLTAGINLFPKKEETKSAATLFNPLPPAIKEESKPLSASLPNVNYKKEDSSPTIPVSAPSNLFGSKDVKPSNLPTLFSAASPQDGNQKPSLFGSAPSTTVKKEQNPLFSFAMPLISKPSKQKDESLNAPKTSTLEIAKTPASNIFSASNPSKAALDSLFGKAQESKSGFGAVAPSGSLFGKPASEVKSGLFGSVAEVKPSSASSGPHTPHTHHTRKIDEMRISNLPEEQTLSNTTSKPATASKEAVPISKESNVSAVPDKVEEANSAEVQSRKLSLLQKIKNQVSTFVSWQKSSFISPPLNSEPTNYLNIKQASRKQHDTLANLKNNFFNGLAEEAIADQVSKSINVTPTFERLLSDRSQQVEHNIKQDLEYYQEFSNKMLYYVNLLGKKKAVNMRASISQMSQSQIIDKNVANLNRITKEYDSKLYAFEQSSELILSDAIHLGEQRKKRKNKRQEKKKGKKYNFQEDFDEEELPKRSANSFHSKYDFQSLLEDNPRSQFKTAIISMSNLKLTPKVKLPRFEIKPIVPQPAIKKAEPKKIQPKKPEQPSISQQTSIPTKPASFFDKIPPPPPKEEKVQVPVVKKPQPKKQEEKQAISEVYEQSNSQQELQLPQSKRQISSIQTVQLKGFKSSATQSKPKAPQTAVKAPEPVAKKGAIGVFEGKKITQPQPQQNMTSSLTTSIFSNQKTATGSSIFGNMGKEQKPAESPSKGKPAESLQKGKPTEQKAALGSIFSAGTTAITAPIAPKKVDQKKEANDSTKPTATAGSIFGQSGGSIFGESKPLSGGLKPSSSASSIFKPAGNDTKPTTEDKAEPKKTTEPAEQPKTAPTTAKQAEKKSEASLSSMFSNLNVKKDDTASPAPIQQPKVANIFGNAGKSNVPAQTSGNIFGNKPAQSLFPQKKAETKAQEGTAPKQEIKQPLKPSNNMFSAQSAQPVAPPVTQPPKQQPFEKAQATTNTTAGISPSNSTTNLNNPQAFQNNQNTAFMGTSFGNNAFTAAQHPAPQFGGGNNRFMNTAAQQNSTGFNPTAASFGGFATGNTQKSFSSFGGGEGNMFQNNQNQGNAFTGQGNMFSQANSNPPLNNNPSFGQNTFQNANTNANTNNNANSNGFNMFSNGNNNNTSTNAFGNNNTNAFGNNAFNNNSSQPNNNTNPSSNMFNTSSNNAFNNANNSNSFGNPSNTGNSNMFNAGNTNNAFSNANNNNNAFSNAGNANSFGNANNNAFGGSNAFSNANTSSNTNFLSKLNPANPITPPPAVNSHLMQMRK